MNRVVGEPLGSSLVRFVCEGEILGTGFVLPGNLVATCAHVVVDGMTADLPMLKLVGFSVDVLARDDEDDIAVVRLVGLSRELLSAPVRLGGDVQGHRFRAVGFTVAEPDGVWVEGKLVGAQGNGRVQMTIGPGGESIVPGFSGAPVWDTELGGVVGMVVTRSGTVDTTAHLVPVVAFGKWTVSSQNPYLGLKPFQAADAERFYGRDEEIAELEELLGCQDMVAIAGPSGSGKSSLVRAGLLPRLAQAGATIVELGMGESVHSVPDGAVLFLDQFEEEVIADPAAARERLGNLIRIVAGRERIPGEPAPLRVVLTLRSKSLDDLIGSDIRRELNQAVWLLEPMNRTKLAEVITRPAHQAGALAFENGLVDRILNDAAPGHGTLPLLSRVLEQLWEHRSSSWLTHAAYEEIGELYGALGKHADDAIVALRPGGAELARRLLTQLARPDGDGGFLRHTARLTDFDPEVQKIARKLANRENRLLVIRDDQVALIHQVLIDGWQNLRSWLAEDEKFLVWQAKLHNLQESGGQLGGTALAEAVEWLDVRSSHMSVRQKDFIRHSKATQHRTQRRWRTITAFSVALTLIALLLTGAVLKNQAQLNDRLHTANAAKLAKTAINVNDANPRQALQLALAAYREKPDSDEAYGALLQQRIQWTGIDRVLPPEVPILSASSLVGQVLASADGHVVVTFPSDHTKPSVWWDLDGSHPRHRELPISANATAALSPNGHILAVHEPRTGIVLIDPANPSKKTTLIGSGDYTTLTFSSNSQYLTAITNNLKTEIQEPNIRVWNLKTRLEISNRVRLHAKGDVPDSENIVSLQDAYPSVDGKILVVQEHIQSIDQPEVVKNQNIITVRDIATGARLREYSGGTGIIARNGTMIVTCDDNNGIVVIEPLTGRQIAHLPPESSCGTFLELDATGQYITVSSRHGRDQRIDLSELDRPIKSPDEVDSGRPKIVITPNEVDLTVIANGGFSQRVSATPTMRPPSPSDDVSDSEVSVDGRLRVTFGSSDGEAFGALILQDDRGEVLHRAAVSDYPESMSFDSTGKYLAVALNGVLRIYSTSTMAVEGEAKLPLPTGRDSADTYGQISMLRDTDGKMLIGMRGMLTSWNLATGEQVDPARTIVPPDENGYVHDGPLLVERPQHPGQVLLSLPGRVILWNTHEWRKLKELPFDSAADDLLTPVISHDGSIAAMSGIGDSVLLINLDTWTQLRPIRTTVSSVVGFFGKYMFVSTYDGQYESESIEIWLWQEQRRVSKFSNPGPEQPTVKAHEFIIGPRSDQGNSIPLVPDQLFQQLCRISDREYSDEERKSLPSGVGHERPCAER